MSIITQEELMAVNPESIKDVTVEALPDKTFRIKAWTAGQRLSLERFTMNAQERKDYKAISSLKLRSVAMSLVDENGALMFNDADMDVNLEKLSVIDSRITEELFKHVSEFNGTSKGAGEDAEKK